MTRNREFRELLDSIGDGDDRRRYLLAHRGQLRYLPEEGMPSGPLLKSAATIAPLTDLRVLWVDDKPENNRNEDDLMRENGAEVFVASSSGEAKEILSSQRVDAR